MGERRDSLKIRPGSHGWLQAWPPRVGVASGSVLDVTGYMNLKSKVESRESFCGNVMKARTFLWKAEGWGSVPLEAMQSNAWYLGSVCSSNLRGPSPGFLLAVTFRTFRQL